VYTRSLSAQNYYRVHQVHSLDDIVRPCQSDGSDLISWTVDTAGNHGRGRQKQFYDVASRKC